jgi:hypothetical protein
VNNLASRFVSYNSSDRRLQGYVFAFSSVTLAPFTVAPASGFVFGVVTEMKQSVHAFRRFDINRTAVASVTA